VFRIKLPLPRRLLKNGLSAVHAVERFYFDAGNAH